MTKFLTAMTLVLLAVTLCSAAIDKEKLMQEFMEVAETCRSEVGASQGDIDGMKEHQPAAGMEGKCLRACMMKHYKIMDSNGKLVKENAMECAKKMADGNAEKLSKAMAIIETCAGLAVTNDHCEAADAYGKCMKETAKAHGMTDFHM